MRSLFSCLLVLIIGFGTLHAGNADAAPREIIERAITNTLPACCYPYVFQISNHYLPGVTDGKHYNNACDIFASLSRLKRFSDKQRECPKQVVEVLRRIQAKEVSASSYVPDIIKYKKTTDLTKTLEFGISEAWRALRVLARRIPLSLEEVNVLRDALNLTARAITKSVRVISPERRLGLVRQYTGISEAIIPNFFPEELADTDALEEPSAPSQPASVLRRTPIQQNLANMFALLAEQETTIQTDATLDAAPASSATLAEAEASLAPAPRVITRPQAKRTQHPKNKAHLPAKRKQPALVPGQQLMSRFFEPQASLAQEGSSSDLPDVDFAGQSAATLAIEEGSLMATLGEASLAPASRVITRPQAKRTQHPKNKAHLPAKRKQPALVPGQQLMSSFFEPQASLAQQGSSSDLINIDDINSSEVSLAQASLADDGEAIYVDSDSDVEGSRAKRPRQA
jgi:hypothetical protein